MRITDLIGNVYILPVSNERWTLELDHNLLSIISLARKSVEMYLKKASKPSGILIDEEVFGLADIIKN